MSEGMMDPAPRAAVRMRSLRVGLAAALLVALTAAGLSEGGAPASTEPAAAVSAPLTLPAAATGDVRAAEMVSRFALNALLATLIDDDTPPRWTDVAIHHFCGPATRVEIDGKPLVAGDRVPATAFTVRWRMDACWPFDPATVALSGVVDLLVFHEGDGLGAVVFADRMVISGAPGESRLHRPFAASLSLAGSAVTQ